MPSKALAKQPAANLQRTAVNAFAPIQREFNRLFDDLANGWNSLIEVELTPRIDVRETAKALEMTVELPGIAQDDVRIAVEDGVLTVSGEKRAEKETKNDNYRVAERAYGAFSRSITLPRSVDADRITAKMTDGVLKISAPKQAGAESRQIKIEAKK